MKNYAILCAAILLNANSFAQVEKDKEKEKKWNVSEPKGTYTDLEFTTSEGTWMNLDVSPDCKNIVFDLLGDIYLLSVTGGVANIIRSGFPYEVQPRLSPD